MSVRQNNLPPSVERYEDDMFQTKYYLACVYRMCRSKVTLRHNFMNTTGSLSLKHAVSITLFPVSFINFLMLCSCGFINMLMPGRLRTVDAIGSV